MTQTASLIDALDLGSMPEAMQAFLRGLESGDWEPYAAFLANDVFYDASVPEWRFQYAGSQRVHQAMYEDWPMNETCHLTELHVAPTPTGYAVDFAIEGVLPTHGDQPSGRQGARMACFFELEGGLVREHRYYCCGAWSAKVLDRIEAEAPKAMRM